MLLFFDHNVVWKSQLAISLLKGGSGLYRLHCTNASQIPSTESSACEAPINVYWMNGWFEGDISSSHEDPSDYFQTTLTCLTWLNVLVMWSPWSLCSLMLNFSPKELGWCCVLHLWAWKCFFPPLYLVQIIIWFVVQMCFLCRWYNENISIPLSSEGLRWGPTKKWKTPICRNTDLMTNPSEKHHEMSLLVSAIQDWFLWNFFFF